MKNKGVEETGGLELLAGCWVEKDNLMTEMHTKNWSKSGKIKIDKNRYEKMETKWWKGYWGQAEWRNGVMGEKK